MDSETDAAPVPPTPAAETQPDPLELGYPDIAGALVHIKFGGLDGAVEGRCVSVSSLGLCISVDGGSHIWAPWSGTVVEWQPSMARVRL